MPQSLYREYKSEDHAPMSFLQHLNNAADLLPENLQASVAVALQRIAESQPQSTIDLLSPTLIAEIPVVAACSEFVSRAITSDPTLLDWLNQHADLDRPRTQAQIQEMVHQCCRAGAASESRFMTDLRVLRRREWVRLAWRDLTNRAELNEVIETLSFFADACVIECVDFIEAGLRTKFGQPTNSAGKPVSGLVVIAMGKLGGYELNFSSDIDVIFCHPVDGETSGGERQVSNQQYAINCAQRLIKILGEKTADGFVFRTDARLRPNGDSGPLSLSFDAMEHYYQTHGREWERYAMIKARIIVGDGRELLERLSPFVYRKYLDFGAFESVRDLHHRISRELDAGQSAKDIKRGFGGIRQIEFIVQSFQLMRGGREAPLRTTSLKKALLEIVRLGQMSESAATQLLADYIELRRIEHRLQIVDDAQTHSLPDPQDPVATQRLSYAMNEADYAVFEADLEQIRQRTYQSFLATFGLDREDQPESDEQTWTDGKTDWSEDEEFNQLLVQFREGASWRNLSTEGHDRLDRLMPSVIEHCLQQREPTRVLARVIRVLETIGRRTTYFAMLYEYPGVLDRLVRLCAASPQLAAMLGRQPILFDELLRPEQDFNTEIALDLNYDESNSFDLEHTMTELRELKSQRFFQIANEKLSGRIDHGEESLALTQLAESILIQVERCVRLDLGDRLPTILQDDDGFMSIAYGKLGSWELGYTSDLDIVFLYDEGETFDAGLAHQAGRFAQRLISLMTTRLASGLLYEIDTQLRPSGRSGTLVSSLDAFYTYQNRDAWTWEHQALVRARPVTGSARMRGRFSQMRRELLSKPRDPALLRQDILDMQKRITSQRDKSTQQRIDLKFGKGGLVDIEFIVQYLVLKNAMSQPGLLDQTTTPTMIARLVSCDALSDTNAETLSEAYSVLLNHANELRFMESPALIAPASVAPLTDAVSSIWTELFLIET